jgi:hypothetical protein
MNSDFTFPLALCKAHYGIWLHALEFFETAGSRVLQDSIALTRAQEDAVTRAQDWHTLAMAPVHALRPPGGEGFCSVFPMAAAVPTRTPEPTPSRRVVVQEALHTLHDALAGPPPARGPHRGRKTAAMRRKA